MKNFRRLAALGLLLFAAAGCASDQQTLNNNQGNATEAAVRRGQFEMSCPQATGTVLSENMLQPVMWGGNERVEYTIGVEGCGKKSTYIVVCQLGSIGCVAASGRNNTVAQ